MYLRKHNGWGRLAGRSLIAFVLVAGFGCFAIGLIGAAGFLWFQA